MPAAIDTQVKKQVINQWLSGDSRDRIAGDNKIGAGTVSNIINEWKKGVENSDYENIRELSLFSKKQGLNLGEYACSIRLNNYIVNIGTNPDEIESFIANLANSSEPEKLIDVANQIARVSRSESIPLADLEMHVKQREEEIQRLEEEIKQRRVILESTNVDVQTISEYTHLKEELNKYQLSTEDPTRLLLILRTIKQIGYDPQKIVARFSRIQSLRQTEKGLKDNCKMLEERCVKMYYH
jgi:5'-3' exonuclease